jgi:putative heme-binding domain-containing protein
VRSLLAALLALSFVSSTLAADPFIPRRQSKPPGPPKSPAEAIAAMEVPEGFSVELVASEPDLVNPVAMTIDEKGRFWVCESLEYPRHEPGVGRDRIKVLEDTDRDGKVDKTWVYADGLNIPSGIAVGHGGVWVANAPDILFLQDTNGDGKADTREVVVTGFGRDDTHELPNSLTWGPDGWLYGLNGVFNPAHVTQDGKTYNFTCAVFRIHPVTRKFELFAEGTSNPWGIAFNEEGELFVSACVIDHFWHLTESGYYIRQGGPYPPNTWILPSIVKHTHQAAAYCGIHYCDSDAFPKEWRNIFLMGNIHGNCINADVTERRGSTYFGTPRKDFLTSNDVWFMTVEQMTGPDGSLYVLDWYDRYHCYQDASADPKGVDRLHGRLYRIRYKDTPYLPKDFDLSKETDVQLIGRLEGGNDFLRATARRLLAERLYERRVRQLEKQLSRENGRDTRPSVRFPPQLVLPSISSIVEAKQLRDNLWDIVLNGDSKQAQLNAMWTLVSGDALEDFMLITLFDHDEATFRAWSVRAAGNLTPALANVRHTPPVKTIGNDWNVKDTFTKLAADPSPDVRLQVAIAAPKLLPGEQGIPVLLEVLQHAGDDPLIPAIVWQNLKPLLDEHGPKFIALAKQSDRSDAVNAVLSRYADMLLSSKGSDVSPVIAIVKLFNEGGNAGEAGNVLRDIQNRIVSGEIAQNSRMDLATALSGVTAPALKDDKSPLHRNAVLLATALGDDSAALLAERLLNERRAPEEDRLAAAEALIAGNPQAAHKIAHIASDANSGSVKLRGDLLAAVGRSDSADVASAVLQDFAELEPGLQPRAIELLVQRPAWSEKLIAAIEAKQISKDAVSVNQVRRLVGSSDKDLAKKATAIWGQIREGRNPEREKVIATVREQLKTMHGDPFAGEKAFAKVCGQCHKIYGNGEEVGPDITRNGRNDYEQLLSNVLDPSLVIGAGYQARTVITSDGRVLSGLVVEDTPERIVLKMQGGKTETIPRSDVEEDAVSPLSLMPEGLERQLSPQELADLIAFLSLDKPPSDKDARRLPGAPAGK